MNYPGNLQEENAFGTYNTSVNVGAPIIEGTRPPEPGQKTFALFLAGMVEHAKRMVPTMTAAQKTKTMDDILKTVKTPQDRALAEQFFLDVGLKKKGMSRNTKIGIGVGVSAVALISAFFGVRKYRSWKEDKAEVKSNPDDEEDDGGWNVEDENIPCEKCGRTDLPLFTDYLCPECHQ